MSLAFCGEKNAQEQSSREALLVRNRLNNPKKEKQKGRGLIRASNVLSLRLAVLVKYDGRCFCSRINFHPTAMTSQMSRSRNQTHQTKVSNPVARNSELMKSGSHTQAFWIVLASKHRFVGPSIGDAWRGWWPPLL